MAYEGEQPIKLPGFTAAADLSGKQYYFVKISGAGQVNVCSAATDVPCGVLQNKPTSGQPAEIVALGVTKVSSDAGLTAGNLIGTSGDGQADAKAVTDTTEYVAGTVLKGTSNAGELATAMVNCINPTRAN